MKKLMIAAAAMMAGVAMADVESANIVGYTTIHIATKWQCIGVNFQGVDGGSLKINDLVPYQEGMTKGTTTGDSDQIQISNTTGSWQQYFMSNGKNKKGSDVAGLEGKWSKSGEYKVSEATLTPGQAFWYVRYDDTKEFDLAVAGSVVALASSDMECISQWRCFSNPYAVDLPINGGTFAYDPEKMTAGTTTGDSDQIQIGNTTGSWQQYFLSNGKNKKGSDVAGLEGKWSKSGEYKVSDAVIPVGRAAWYVRKDTSKPAPTFTFVKPYDL